MKTNEHHYAGVDVSKAELVAFYQQWKAPRTFENSITGIKALIKTLPPSTHFVCEASGGYERPLVDACFRKQVPVSILNALRVHEFAKASGRLAKTDNIDAEVIVDFANCFKPQPQEPPRPVQLALKESVRHRDRLMRDKVRMGSQLEKTCDAYVRKDLRAAIKSIERRLAKLDTHISEIIDSDHELKTKRKRLELIKCVGPILSATLLGELPS